MGCVFDECAGECSWYVAVLFYVVGLNADDECPGGVGSHANATVIL